MGTNMWSSSLLLGLEGESIATFPVDELIEKADGFAGVIPGDFTFFLARYYTLLLVLPSTK